MLVYMARRTLCHYNFSALKHFFRISFNKVDVQCRLLLVCRRVSNAWSHVLDNVVNVSVETLNEKKFNYLHFYLGRCFYIVSFFLCYIKNFTEIPYGPRKQTPLVLASCASNADIVTLIVEHENSKRQLSRIVNIQDGAGYSALMYACKLCCFDIAEYLLNVDGIDVNLQNNNGDTVLMEACRWSYARCIKLLFDRAKNVDIFVRNIKGDNAMDLAKRANIKEIVEFLETHNKL